MDKKNLTWREKNAAFCTAFILIDVLTNTELNFLFVINDFNQVLFINQIYDFINSSKINETKKKL